MLFLSCNISSISSLNNSPLNVLIHPPSWRNTFEPFETCSPLDVTIAKAICIDWPCRWTYNGNSFHCQSEKKKTAFIDLHSIIKVEYQFENKQITHCLDRSRIEKSNILNYYILYKPMCYDYMKAGEIFTARRKKCS